MPRASERRSPAAQRHADTVRFVLFEARPAGLAFNHGVTAARRCCEHRVRELAAALHAACTDTSHHWPTLCRQPRPDPSAALAVADVVRADARGVEGEVELHRLAREQSPVPRTPNR
ncbi:hypothetical protein [Streptomyces broussonetiae]|uniref:hypothetical protein n=1 Tax=Streptomyces broussonetiae TaxID=2686304 RepID=UPI001E47CEBA|nr:hypothetical protein [Streptomyces broussonetiae]